MMPQIIFSIVNRAELTQHKAAFEALIDERLKMGQVLLLIDGLDEISNEQHRVRFVDQLQTFMRKNPTVRLLITSRETGFRVVAGQLSSYCKQYAIADLDNDRIRKLSENWHKTLLDNQGQAKEDSDSVCNVILRDSRITALARNPLLLTTLLFVKRWIGYLPTKKCQLYQEMIKLLLVSWNAAAHLRMDMEETEPQLAFVAFTMTKEGKQTIRKEELIRCIIDARRALPDLLGYTKVKPSEFIDQVEERSSILIQQGLEEDERGNLVPLYEFSHLSFQEYLTAKAISENWLSENGNTDSVSVYLTILKKHYDENQWLEVIPLAAVLLKRQAKLAMEYLLRVCQDEKMEQCSGDTKREKRHEKEFTAFHLANCIACEVPLASEMLEPALLAIANQSMAIEKISIDVSHANIFRTIYHSEKYGESLKSVVGNELFGNKDRIFLADLSKVWLQICCEENEKLDVESILQLLKHVERKNRISGALLMMKFSFGAGLRERAEIKMDHGGMNSVFALIKEMLDKEDAVATFAASWCIAWAGYNEANIIPNDLELEIAARLIHLWCTITAPYDLRRSLSWAICTISQPGLRLEASPALSESIMVHLKRPKNRFDKKAALYLRLLLGEVTVEDVKKVIRRPNRFLKEME